MYWQSGARRGFHYRTAAAYDALGTPVYSSAVFNFIPRISMEFQRAVASDHHEAQHRLLHDFFMPWLDLRNRCPGCAVSTVKAARDWSAMAGGLVSTRLTNPRADELARLDALIKTLEAQ